jgi:hypothetical protein
VKDDGGRSGGRLAAAIRDGERLTGVAMANLFEKNKTADVGAAVDSEDGVTITEAGRYTLGCRLCNEGSVIAVIEGEPGAEMTIRKALIVISGAQIYMREGEDRHEREESVLDASGSLRHKRLAAW